MGYVSAALERSPQPLPPLALHWPELRGRVETALSLSTRTVYFRFIIF